MSVDKPKSEEPVPDTRIEAIKAAVEAGLAEFDRHKRALLTILRDEHNPKSEPFNEHKAWFRLTSLANTYYWQARVKREIMPIADREVRLRKLAMALGKARRMTDKAMQDDVGDDLFSAWCEENDVPRASIVQNADGSSALVRVADETFKEAVAVLAALETAALRATGEVHEGRAGRGRPGRGILPPGFIETLATLYRDSTGSKPGAGLGPFVRFVCAFLAAIRANISEDYVVELIQAARSRGRTPRESESSPFED